MNGSGTKPVPISSLSIQSFHNDSPPFTGSADSPPPHGQPSYLDLSQALESASSVSGGSSNNNNHHHPGTTTASPAPNPSSSSSSSAASSSSSSSAVQPPLPPSSLHDTNHHSDSTTNSHFRNYSSPPTNQVTQINGSLNSHHHHHQQQQAPPLRTRHSQSVLPPSPSASTRTIKPIRPYHSDTLPSPSSAYPPLTSSPSSQTIVPPYNHGDPVPSPAAVRHTPAPSFISAYDGEPDIDVDGDGDGEADALSLVGAERLLPSLGDSGKYLRGEGDYLFPKHRLKSVWDDQEKTPLVIVACGSFSPPTYLHLRMFEMAKDQILESDQYEILGGYYSPVSDHYKKAGLAPAQDRVKMCELAVESTSTWLMVDPWEAGQESYQRTAVVLQHFEEELNGGPNGGVRTRNGGRQRIKIMLLAGGDLIESFGHPGVWAPDDLHVILGQFGCLIVERAGSDVWAFLLSHDILYHHRRNIIVIKQLIYNDISSTKVRLFVRRAMSIKYLLPNSVIQYIYDQKLYTSEAPAVPLEAVTTTSPPPRTVPPTPSALTERKKFFVADSDSRNSARTTSA